MNPFTRTPLHPTLLTLGQVSKLPKILQSSQSVWSTLPLATRIAKISQALAPLSTPEQHASTKAFAHAITSEVGKPLSQSFNELKGALVRTQALCDLAPDALAPIRIANSSHSTREIHKEPLGTVLTLAPWNYPVLTSINSVIPALLAGNAVVVTTGLRAPSAAAHLAELLAREGAPIASFTAAHQTIHSALRRGLFDYVVFTGNVAGGHAVARTLGAIPSRFVRGAFELGGCDAAYVKADAHVDSAAESLVDGAMYNAGQSCCGIQRVYVADAVHDAFMARAKALVQAYVMGDPMDPQTTMGPLTNVDAPAELAKVVAEAVSAGAHLVAGTGMPALNGSFFSPTLLGGCRNDMRVMREECFGPIMAVSRLKPGTSDAQVAELINDCPFGLTASVYTSSPPHELARMLNVGTVLMNRCDYLDPYLAFSGRKDSGNGLALSSLSFAAYYRTKSLHFRH